MLVTVIVVDWPVNVEPTDPFGVPETEIVLAVPLNVAAVVLGTVATRRTADPVNPGAEIVPVAVPVTDTFFYVPVKV